MNEQTSRKKNYMIEQKPHRKYSKKKIKTFSSRRKPRIPFNRFHRHTKIQTILNEYTRSKSKKKIFFFCCCFAVLVGCCAEVETDNILQLKKKATAQQIKFKNI